METSKAPFEKYLFICENKRESGACCGVAGERLREGLKEEIKKRGLASRIRVSRSGCLDTCAEGPNVLLVPQRVWFKQVQESDIERIIQKTLEE